MIDYNKVRHTFQKWTSILSILYFINAFVFLLTTLGSFANKLILKKRPELLSSFSQQELEILKMTTTPIALGTFIAGFVITLIIGIMTLVNCSYIKRSLDKQLNITIYYIAIAWAILSIFLEFLYHGTISFLSPIFMLIFGFANLFTLHKVIILKERN